MGAIRGIIRKGQVIMIEPADLPDETEVAIVPVGVTGSTDGEGPMSPGEIARTLAALDEVEPFEMSDEERAAFEAHRQAHRGVGESSVQRARRPAPEPVGMRRYLMDTGIAGDFINRRHGIFERARQEAARGNPVGIGIPVLAELAYGVEQSASRDRNMQRLMKALAAWRVWPFDDEAAFEYGRIAAELRRIGRPMQQIDIQIAAIAFALGNCTVVSGDSDLKAIPGLVVEDWAAEAAGPGS